MMPDPLRLVFEDLPEFWAQLLGIPVDDAVVSPTADVFDWLQSLGRSLWEEVDLADVSLLLGTRYGIDDVDGLIDLFQLGSRSSIPPVIADMQLPRLTMGELAIWIAERIPVCDFSPVNIAGVTCAAAGAFFGLRDLAGSGMFGIHGIAPSTRIADCFSGANLNRFWTFLTFVTGGAIPQLTWPWEGWAKCLYKDAALSILFAVLLIAVNIPGGSFENWGWRCYFS